MSSTTSPALPAFSYAQAAKGHVQSTATTQNIVNASSVPSEASTRERENSSGEPAKLELTSRLSNGRSEDSNRTQIPNGTQDAHKEVLVMDEIVNKENIAPTGRSGSPGEENKATISATSSPSFGATSTSTLPKDEEILMTPNDTNESWEKHSQVSTSVEKSTQTADGGKSNDQQEDWEKDASAKVTVEKELKAAPLPTVNFWQARIDAQDARTKTLTTQRPTPAAPKGKPQAPSTLEGQKGLDERSKSKQASKAPSKVEKDDSITRKRQAEPTRPREDGRRQQTRQPRSPGQEVAMSHRSAPPPVGDAESWPTPDTAISEERKKSTSQDRPEKLESRNGGVKPHTKQWVPVPYVPSAKFITPLPLAATRRGGRPAIRGGPEETSRNGPVPQGTPTSSKNEVQGSMGPPPLPKQNGEQDRGRNQNESSTSRANSVPTQAKRATSASARSAAQRQSSATFSKEFTDADSKKHSSQEPRSSTDNSPKNESGLSGRSRGESNSYSKPAYLSDASFRRPGLETGVQQTSAGDAHSHPRYDPANRRSTPADFYTNSDVFGNHEQGITGRNKEQTRSRDYSKDKVESSRDKVQSWRDREVTLDKEGREQRPERTRGGYRGGRGSHTSYGGPSSSAHPFTSPLPQQSFAPAKSNSYHNSHRQSSQPYPAMSSQNGQRNNLRSQSIPTNAMYNPVTHNMPAMQQPLSPLQTDASMYAYQQPMYPGIMSAMPHTSALDSYALLAMVHSQLEYYFSIDNLCKDLFLRKHMDSQGYVLLSVIADFKRIKALTDDMDMLRHVCGQLKAIEFRPGEDGVDRLRRKEGWEQWIRPIAERDPSARNDGPPTSSRPAYRKQGSSERTHFAGPAFNAPAFRSTHSWTNDTHRDGSAIASSSTMHANAAVFDAHFSETPTSATVPDMPSADKKSMAKEAAVEVTEEQIHSPGLTGTVDTNGSLSNGHSPIAQVPHEDNVFPEEKIAELKVVVRSPDALVPPMQPSFLSNSSRTFSHGSIDGQTLSADAQVNGASNAILPGLRGGSGSAEQLERERTQPSPHPGQLAHLNYQSGSLPVFWVKDGAPLVGLNQEGLAHEPYESLHDRAFQQRLYGNTAEDMEVLYQFWSHFLIRNFNGRMYDEFQTMALEDSSRGADSGVQHLVRYYEALLSGQSPLSERLATDLVHLAHDEAEDSPRPAFQILRTAWRNGAFNLKSRKRVDTVLTPTLRTELEK